MKFITMNNWLIKTSLLLMFYFFSSSGFALDYFKAHTKNKAVGPQFSELMLALKCNGDDDILLLKNGEIKAADFADFVLFNNNDIGTCLVGVANESGNWDAVGSDPVTLTYQLINVADADKAAVWQFQSIVRTSRFPAAKENFFLMGSKDSKGVYEVSWRQDDMRQLPPLLALKIIPHHMKPQ